MSLLFLIKITTMWNMTRLMDGLKHKGLKLEKGTKSKEEIKIKSSYPFYHKDGRKTEIY